MIVDAHHHIFQHWIDPCGHSSRQVHVQQIQQMFSRHSASSVLRARDGSPGSLTALFRGGKRSWETMADVNLRIGKYGRLEFTVDGEDYHIQFFPVGMQELQAPPELAMAQMRYAGVDHCILQAGHFYGAMSDYNAFAQNQYRKQFTGQMQVDEPRAGTTDVLAEVDRAYHKLGLRSLFFAADTFSKCSFEYYMDDLRMWPFWEKLRDLGVVVCIELSAGPEYDKNGYIRNLLQLGHLLEEFRGTRFHLAMGVPVQYFAQNGTWEWSPEVGRVLTMENLWVEVTFPISWGGVWDYPYPQAQRLIRDLCDKVGTERLLWGSDMPNVERFCTYRQSLDFISRQCRLLTEHEKDLILGSNATRLYELETRSIP